MAGDLMQNHMNALLEMLHAAKNDDMDALKVAEERAVRYDEQRRNQQATDSESYSDDDDGDPVEESNSSGHNQSRDHRRHHEEWEDDSRDMTRDGMTRGESTQSVADKERQLHAESPGLDDDVEKAAKSSKKGEGNFDSSGLSASQQQNARMFNISQNGQELAMTLPMMDEISGEIDQAEILQQGPLSGGLRAGGLRGVRSNARQRSDGNLEEGRPERRIRSAAAPRRRSDDGIYADLEKQMAKEMKRQGQGRSEATKLNQTRRRSDEGTAHYSSLEKEATRMMKKEGRRRSSAERVKQQQPAPTSKEETVEPAAAFDGSGDRDRAPTSKEGEVKLSAAVSSSNNRRVAVDEYTDEEGEELSAGTREEMGPPVGPSGDGGFRDHHAVPSMGHGTERGRKHSNEVDRLQNATPAATSMDQDIQNRVLQQLESDGQDYINDQDEEDWGEGDYDSDESSEISDITSPTFATYQDPPTIVGDDETQDRQGGRGPRYAPGSRFAGMTAKQVAALANKEVSRRLRMDGKNVESDNDEDGAKKLETRPRLTDSPPPPSMCSLIADQDRIRAQQEQKLAEDQAKLKVQQEQEQLKAQQQQDQQERKKRLQERREKIQRDREQREREREQQLQASAAEASKSAPLTTGRHRRAATSPAVPKPELRANKSAPGSELVPRHRQRHSAAAAYASQALQTGPNPRTKSILRNAMPGPVQPGLAGYTAPPNQQVVTSSSQPALGRRPSGDTKPMDPKVAAALVVGKAGGKAAMPPPKNEPPIFFPRGGRGATTDITRRPSEPERGGIKKLSDIGTLLKAKTKLRHSGSGVSDRSGISSSGSSGLARHKSKSKIGIGKNATTSRRQLLGGEDGPSSSSSAYFNKNHPTKGSRAPRESHTWNETIREEDMEDALNPKNIDIEALMSTMGKDIDYIFRELSALDAEEAVVHEQGEGADLDDDCSLISASAMGATAKIKYTLGSVASSLRQEERKASRRPQPATRRDANKSRTSSILKNSRSAKSGAGTRLNKEPPSDNAKSADPLLIDEDGFIISSTPSAPTVASTFGGGGPDLGNGANLPTGETSTSSKLESASSSRHKMAIDSDGFLIGAGVSGNPAAPQSAGQKRESIPKREQIGSSSNLMSEKRKELAGWNATLKEGKSRRQINKQKRVPQSDTVRDVDTVEGGDSERTEMIVTGPGGRANKRQASNGRVSRSAHGVRGVSANERLPREKGSEEDDVSTGFIPTSVPDLEKGSRRPDFATQYDDDDDDISKIDAVEEATKKRIEMLRRVVAEKAAQMSEDYHKPGSSLHSRAELNTKLDYVEQETLKQISRLRQRYSTRNLVE